MYISSYKFIRAINKIKNEDFSKELLQKIDEYSNKLNSNVNIKKNVLTIIYNDIEINIILNKKSIEYQFNKKDETINKKYVKFKNGYYIKTNNIEFCRYGRNLVDKKQTDTYKLYDKKGMEQYRKINIKKDCFYQNKNGKLIRIEPKKADNYRKDSYIFRIEQEYILKREKEKYSYLANTKGQYKTEETDDFYIRFQKIDKNSSNIPDYGHFYGIDKDVVFKYFKKKKYKIQPTYWV